MFCQPEGSDRLSAADFSHFLQLFYSLLQRISERPAARVGQTGSAGPVPRRFRVVEQIVPCKTGLRASRLCRTAIWKSACRVLRLSVYGAIFQENARRCSTNPPSCTPRGIACRSFLWRAARPPFLPEREGAYGSPSSGLQHTGGDHKGGKPRK